MRKQITAVLVILGMLLPNFAFAQATTQQGGTGTSSPSGILYGDGTLQMKTVVIGTNMTFSGGTLSSTGGAASGGWPFTPSTYNGVSNQSTTTPFWLKNTQIIASTTLFTMASTSGFTNNGSTWLTNLTNGQLLSLGANGLVQSTTTIGNNQLANSSITVNGTAISLGSSGTITAATSSLLTDNNTFSGNNLFSASTTFSTQINLRNASTSQETIGTAWFPNLAAYNLIATDANSKVVATSSIGNSLLANSTISGISLGGTLGALSATDATLTFSGSYTGATARTVGVNLGNTNIWSALQNQSNTGTTTFSGGIESGTKIAAPYFNATSSTATSTFIGGIKSPCFSNDGISCIIGSSITGSGSANQVAYWSGTSALTSNAKFAFNPADATHGSLLTLGSGASSDGSEDGYLLMNTYTGPSNSKATYIVSSNTTASPITLTLPGTQGQIALTTIAGGGTNATLFGTTNGILAYNGTRLANFANFTLTSSLLTASNATSTQFSAYQAYFGGTATTTIDTAGNVTLPSSATLTATKATITNASTTNFTVSSGPVNANIPLPFYMASSTWGTGTTTIEVLNNINNMTWKDARCHTNAGTLEMRLYTDTVNDIQYWSASTTRNTLTFSSNNVLSTATTTFLDIGNAASSPTSTNCTFEYQYNGS